MLRSPLNKCLRVLSLILLQIYWSDYLQRLDLTTLPHLILLGVAQILMLQELFLMIADILHYLLSSDGHSAEVELFVCQSGSLTDPSQKHSYLQKLQQLVEEGQTEEDSSTSSTLNNDETSSNSTGTNTKTLMVYQGSDLVGSYQVPSGWKLTDILSQVDGDCRLRWRVFPPADDQSLETAIVPPDNWPVDRLKLVWENSGQTAESTMDSLPDEVVAETNTS